MRDDRGSASVELVVLSGAVLALVSVLVYAGRYNVAASDVETAARLSARTLSMARNFDEGAVEAEQVAQATVDGGADNPFCREFSFDPDVDTSDPDVVTVTVTVTCVADFTEAAMLNDITTLGISDSVSITATATEVVDRYREDEL